MNKNHMFKALRLLIAAAIMAAAMGITAFAANNITSVSVRLSEEKGEPGSVWMAEPTVNSNDYYVEGYEWSTDYEFWEPGKKVTLTVELGSDEKTFDKDANVYVTNGEKVKASRNNTHSMKVKINYIPKVVLSVPQGVWYEDEYLLAWDKVEYAGGYEVALYRDGRQFKTLKLEGRGTTEADLSEYATDDYLVTAKIRSVGPKGKTSYIQNSEWLAFDDEGVSMDGDSTAAGQFTGSGNSKRFKDEDNNYVDGWQFINGYWYYFNPDTHNAVTSGWINTGAWYLMDADGRMLTGWQQDAGYWYFLDPASGAMHTGWVQTTPMGAWYWLNAGEVPGLPYGAMLANGVTPDGFAVNANGEWRP